MQSQLQVDKRVLVVGGLSGVGKNVVKELLNRGFTKIQVVDYGLLELELLSPVFRQAFDKVEYHQVNLSTDSGVEKCFHTSDGEGVDWIINCCSVINKGKQAEELYRTRIYSSSLKLAKAAIRNGVKCFVHISPSALEYIYDPVKPSTESSPRAAWEGSFRSKFLLETEDALTEMDGLPLVVLRCVVPNGVGDYHWSANILAFLQCVIKLGIPMPRTVFPQQKRCTVHVEDVARAACHVAEIQETLEEKSVFNVSPSLTTVGDFEQVFQALFPHIRFDPAPPGPIDPEIIHQARKDTNDCFFSVWLDLLNEQGITHTPITPYMDRDFISPKSWWIDGSKICNTGFEYLHKKFTVEDLREHLDDCILAKVLPDLR